MTTAEYIKTSLVDFKPTSHKINLINPFVNDTADRYFKIKDSSGHKFQVLAYTSKIGIESKLQTKLNFSINLPNIVLLGHVTKVNELGIKIYTDGTPDNFVLNFLTTIHDDLKSLNLKENEGFHIYRNGVSFIVNQSRTIVPEIQILKRIIVTLERDFPDTINTTNVSNIPLNLRELSPLLSKWAISDDFDRTEKIKRSSKATLKKLVDSVSPKIKEINNYLDSFKNEPLSYEATLLQSLAELIEEISIKPEE